MALLGLTFFTFASIERGSAELFSDSTAPTATTDAYWDWALQQLIVGPEPGTATNPLNTHSSLWSSVYSGGTERYRRHSLLGNMFGGDRAPFSGEGIRLTTNATNGPIVADAPNGTAGTQALLEFNYSPAAHGGTYAAVPMNPAPDVDYTAPDINNLFLAFNGWGLDTNGDPVRVVKPSFHRPELLRDTNGMPIVDWYDNAATATKVMRPHPSHMSFGTTYTRFLTAPTTNVRNQTVQPFPFANPDAVASGGNGNGVVNDQGVWSKGITAYNTNPRDGAPDYDVDNDNDGVKEGIWQDLDYPAQTLPDGRNMIPLFSFTIYDLDALINLNTAGNLAGLDRSQRPSSAPGTPFGGGQPMSRSNLGLSPAEVNLWWALDADPTSSADFDSRLWANQSQPYSSFFGSAPADRTEAANMDQLLSLIGRADYSTIQSNNPTIADLIPGRWGDVDHLYRAVRNPGSTIPLSNPNDPTNCFPQPGIVGYDDNSDRLLGEGSTSNNLAIPAYVHPLDFSGGGSFLNLISGSGGDPLGRIPALTGTGAPNPNVWLRYNGYHTYYGNVGYFNANSGNQMLNRELTSYLRTAPQPTAQGGTYYTDQLFDDPMETVFEEVAKSPYDKIFGPDELEGLHRSNLDSDYEQISSRLRKLMPLNLDSCLRASSIRKRFTTVSWDRNQFGLSNFSTQRTWEFNTDTNSDGNLEFPPMTLSTSNANNLNEPYRRELRKILTVDRNNSATGNYQYRLNINKFLTSNANDDYPTSQGTIAYADLNVYYRDLTPHHSNPGSSAIPTTAGTIQSQCSTVAADQEWWARRDRQQMARDIYVLLYTLCGGSDAVNYATASNVRDTTTGLRPIYQDDQLREMARFAVNYVDALDRDNTITRFEYDKDLSDGWNLDDNSATVDFAPLTSTDTGYDSSYQQDSNQRGIVDGVELQQLTFSEALPIATMYCLDHTTMMPKDNPATLYDDRLPTRLSNTELYGRCYNFVELRNAMPYDCDISKNWMISIDYVDRDTSVRMYRDLEIHDGNTSIIPAGNLYTIGGTSTVDTDTSGNPRRTFLNVDPSYDRDAGAGGAAPQAIAPVAAALDLDLHYTGSSGLFTLTDGSGTALSATDWLSKAKYSDGVNYTLYRRQHLGRTIPTTGNSAQQADNPWIKVDSISVGAIPLLDLGDDNDTGTYPTAADYRAHVQAQLQNLFSKERLQPLTKNGEINHASALYANTLGQVNYWTNASLGGTFTLWQPHFDRDFASTMEMLSLPLFGPEHLTTKLAAGTAPSAVLALEDFSDIQLPTRTVQAKVLRPQHVSNVGSMTPDVLLDNRWHRLFEFIQVAGRVHTHSNLRGIFQSPRVPGKLNLNTLRDPTVFAGLIDDPNLITPSITSATNRRVALYDQTDANRDWWFELVKSRDRLDPISNLYLPGTASSRPFRSFSFIADGNSSVEHTLFRSLPLYASSVSGTDLPERLFEVGNYTDHSDRTTTYFTDHYTRNRLLSKIAGNSTTRSNVFVVWITVDFFEAVPVRSGNTLVLNPQGLPIYQIGDRVGTMTPHRMFCVIDRSAAERAYSRDTATATGGFDFRKLVLFQRTIE